jgi:hypothetical protein
MSFAVMGYKAGGVTLSYMALHDHLVSVTAIFFAIMSKLPVMG